MSKIFFKKRNLANRIPFTNVKILKIKVKNFFFVRKVMKEREKVKKWIETKVWAFQMIETPISF